MDLSWLDTVGQNSIEDESLEVLNIESVEDEWHSERLGKFTSSRIGDLMTSGRRKDVFWGDTAMNYIYEKIAELMTGVPHYTPETRAMEWGNDHEEEAIVKYNEISELKAEHMGKTFIKFSDMCGGSPDGYVGENGIIEVKCPYNSANHIRVYITGEIDKKYMFQCQGNMLFSNRDWCDFISYDPRMPEEMQLKIIRVDRDEEICNSILERITKATEEMVRIQELTGIKINIKF